MTPSRVRQTPLSPTADDQDAGRLQAHRGGWRLHDTEIIVLLGENGTGKTTFIRLIAGLIKPGEEMEDLPEFNVSYKPQKISPKFESTVRDLLHKKIRDAYLHPQFQSDVLKPMNIEQLFDNEVKNLSGGELQRVALTLCMGQPADLYLIDEPSAYLDSEQRIWASKVIKRFIIHSKKRRSSSSTTLSWRRTWLIGSWCTRANPPWRRRTSRAACWRA